MIYICAGMLRSGFSLYIAELGGAEFDSAEFYEQELIARWNPVRTQKTTKLRMPVVVTRPWADGLKSTG